MTAPTYEIFCYRCAARGHVARITAGLQCRCGSRDLDLWQGNEEQNRIVASKQSSKVESSALKSTADTSFAEFMTGRKTALAPTPKPTTLVNGDVQGWNEYTGPRPGPNQMQTGVGTPYVCPVCHGSKFDLQDGQACRNCGGTGIMTPNADEHQEVPAVARHDYPSTQTTVPFLGKRKSPQQSRKQSRKQQAPKLDADQRVAGITLKGAMCPRCRCKDTSLICAANRDAWWYCTTKCGALANLDAKPELDPFHPMERFRPNGRAFMAMHKAAQAGEQMDKTGRLMDLVSNIEKTNPGLSRAASLTLARRTLSYAGSR